MKEELRAQVEFRKNGPFSQNESAMLKEQVKVKHTHI